MFLVLVFTMGWIDPRATVRSEGMSLKRPVTPLEIDPGTVRLLVQSLNHYATPDPTTSSCRSTNGAEKNVNIAILCFIMPCRLMYMPEYQCFTETWSLHLEGGLTRVTMKLERATFSETLMPVHQSRQNHISNNWTVRQLWCDKLKSRTKTRLSCKYTQFSTEIFIYESKQMHVRQTLIIRGLEL